MLVSSQKEIPSTFFSTCIATSRPERVPEGRGGLAELSVYENLKLGAYTRKEKKEIGETLKSLLELVLDDPELNNRELLLERICSHE